MLLLVATLWVACMPKGPVPLAAAEPGELVHGTLGYTPTAILTSEPGRSIDLAVCDSGRRGSRSCGGGKPA